MNSAQIIIVLSNNQLDAAKFYCGYTCFMKGTRGIIINTGNILNTTAYKTKDIR